MSKYFKSYPSAMHSFFSCALWFEKSCKFVRKNNMYFFANNIGLSLEFDLYNLTFRDKKVRVYTSYAPAEKRPRHGKLTM